MEKRNESVVLPSYWYEIWRWVTKATSTLQNSFHFLWHVSWTSSDSGHSFPLTELKHNPRTVTQQANTEESTEVTPIFIISAFIGHMVICFLLALMCFDQKLCTMYTILFYVYTEPVQTKDNWAEAKDGIHCQACKFNISTFNYNCPETQENQFWLETACVLDKARLQGTRDTSSVMSSSSNLSNKWAPI